MLRSLAANQAASSIGGVYDRLIACEPGAVQGFVCDAAFWDVGTASDYWSTSWAFIDAGTDATCWHGQRVHIDPTARLTRSILWDDVEVSRDVVLEECLVTDGVRLPAGAVYRRTILVQRRDDGRLQASPLSRMTTSKGPTAEGAEPRDRVERYLRDNGLDGPATTVVPLTGDASDRRYFRLILPDGVSIVLAVHAGPIVFASLAFANVAELLRLLPIPVPAILGHSDALGILALEDLGDVTLQAHLGAATRRSTPPSIARRSS